MTYLSALPIEGPLGYQRKRTSRIVYLNLQTSLNPIGTTTNFCIQLGKEYGNLWRMMKWHVARGLPRSYHYKLCGQLANCAANWKTSLGPNGQAFALRVSNWGPPTMLEAVRGTNCAANWRTSVSPNGQAIALRVSNWGPPHK